MLSYKDASHINLSKHSATFFVTIATLVVSIHIQYIYCTPHVFSSNLSQTIIKIIQSTYKDE